MFDRFNIYAWCAKWEQRDTLVTTAAGVSLSISMFYAVAMVTHLADVWAAIVAAASKLAQARQAVTPTPSLILIPSLILSLTLSPRLMPTLHRASGVWHVVVAGQGQPVCSPTLLPRLGEHSMPAPCSNLPVAARC